MALEAWLRSGCDPHLAPESDENAPSGDDQTPWALVLPTTADLLGLALDRGAEAHRPVFVSGPEGGGHVPPVMAVLAGPLDEAAMKIRKLKEQDEEIVWAKRWPGHDRFYDAAIHLIVTAQFADPSIKQKLAETAILGLIDETLANQNGPLLILMRDHEGRTALQRALELQRLEVAETLLRGATQAQAQALDHHGRSALHTLAEHPTSPRECLPLVRTLMSHGAAWDLPDAEGVTPAQLLERAGKPEERDAWNQLVQRTSLR
jgi:hypothetical protein